MVEVYYQVNIRMNIILSIINIVSYETS